MCNEVAMKRKRNAYFIHTSLLWPIERNLLDFLVKMFFVFTYKMFQDRERQVVKPYGMGAEAIFIFMHFKKFEFVHKRKDTELMKCDISNDNSACVFLNSGRTPTLHNFFCFPALYVSCLSRVGISPLVLVKISQTQKYHDCQVECVLFCWNKKKLWVWVTFASNV